ncbi:MAG: hypothetical protein GKR94_23975 [Gammaproteobacteria bacterium]|nr:hypothetical protein [Gammaproteobacteria bacterium]
MLRAALKALIYSALVWVIAAEWDGGHSAAEAAASWVAALLAPGPPAGLVGVCAIIVALYSAAVLLLNVPVPLERSLGPLRHPFPAQPLRIRLRLWPSRFLAVFLLWSLTLVVALRVLPDLVDAGAVSVPEWAEITDWTDAWLFYGALHGAAALVTWSALAGVGRLLAQSSPARWGFMHYHARRQPLAGCVLRLLLIMHWPLASFTATHLGHPWHVYLIVSALTGVFLAAMAAMVITLWIERSRDRWLVSLGAHEYAIRECTVHFLHPDAGPPYEPGGRLMPEPVTLEVPSQQAAPSAQEGAGVVAAPAGDAPVAPGPGLGNEPAPTDDPAPPDAEFDPVVGRTLDAALACRERGECARARLLLRQVIATGGQAERERAEAIMRVLPGRWRALQYTALALAAACVAGFTVLVWQWFALPSTADTLQLASAAHVHVRKSGTGAQSKVDLLGTRYDYSLNTSLANISPHFVNAVIASEDHRFYEHGVFYKLAKFTEAGLLCALRKLNVFSSARVFSSSRACAGNSTIPQQLARNLLLSEKRSVTRKLTELLWAIKMESGLAKKEILALYMNRLYLGRGNFGVELAARTYFQKPAKDLTLYEAAYLAAAVKRPGWNWHQDRAGAQQRAELIVALMRRHGYAAAGAKMPRPFKPRYGKRPPNKPYLGHLWQWIKPEVTAVLKELPPGDYKVLTTLNAEVEIYAERALRSELRRLRARGVAVSQAAAVVMRPSGAVLAMVGGVGNNVRARGINRAKRTAGLHTRPPASAFKPFVYLAALERDLRPTSRIDARPVSIDMPAPQPPYAPNNHDGKDYGYITMREGLVNSINTAAVNLLHGTIGFDRLFDVLMRLGVDISYFKRQWGVALGANGVPLVEMVGAYAVFANGGRAVTPHAFARITRADGGTVWRRERPPAGRQFAAGDIAAMNEMLVAVVGEGTATRARHKLPKALLIAGKTGTGDAFVDAWFVGYSPDLVIGIWMGNDTPRTMHGLFGGVGPARAFNRLMSDIVEYTDVVQPGLTF